MDKTWEVIVAGAGPAGITAAIAARRQGASVLLIEENGFVGGLAASGLPLLTFHDNSGRKVISGLPQVIVEQLIAEGASLGHIESSNGHQGTITPILSEEAKHVFHEILENEGVNLLLNTRIIEVEISNFHIFKLKAAGREGKITFKGLIFIDCTGDGDLIEAAGENYFIGRDSDGKCQSMTLLFTLAGVDIKKASKFFSNEIIAVKSKNEDTKVIHMMGHLTEGLPEGSRPFTVWGMSLHDGELLINATDIIGKQPLSSWDVTDADLVARRQIKDIHNALRNKVSGFEKSYLAHTFPVMGIRESRRLSGVYCLTKDDVLSGARFNDVIAKSGYCADIHDPEGSGVKFQFIADEGSYDIPYRCLLPKKLENLIVAGRCISADHFALASSRVMANCMAIGEAAGTAASLCALNGIKPKELDVTNLQQVLKSNGAILS